MDAFVVAQRDVAFPIFQRTEQYRSQCKTVLDYIDDRIDEAINRATEADQGELKSKQVRIVDELLKTKKDWYNLEYLILSIFSPAHDTVAIAVANTIFHLVRNPECWATVRAEVSSTASQPLTYELLNSFKYLNWVLRES
jgi:cytochrome P450